MSMGGVYVEVSADMANPGISLLSSGTTGEEDGRYWINWNSASGFTSLGWHYDDSYLKTGWEMIASSLGYEPTEAGFLEYMQNEPENLDNVLGGWDNASKWTFLQSHVEIFTNCTTAV